MEAWLRPNLLQPVTLPGPPFKCWECGRFMKRILVGDGDWYLAMFRCGQCGTVYVWKEGQCQATPTR